MSGAAPETFPRGALTAAGALVVFALLAVAAARLTGFTGVAAVPEPAAPEAWAAAARHLRFEDRPDGSLRVRDAGSGRAVADLEPGSAGFVRGLMRAMARLRRLQGVGPEEPFLLSHGPGGALVLADPATGERIALDAFGPSNLGAFADLLRQANSSTDAAAGETARVSGPVTGEST